MKKWIVIVMVGLILLLGAVGCQKTTDPVTGETQYALDAEKSAEYERQLETGISILMALNVIWPGLIPAGLAAILVGALGAYRHVKPKLTTAETEAAKYYSTTSSVVGAIEKFKETNPADWKKLETKLTETLGPEAVNVIRALRGLPPIQ